ncbi:hypothetical protein AURDEDRAFT_187616 [Auricularia subglabra TFB-10046 SS5]|nr:hypothetical protein AURDEDRAFT_187616 [Auricularia subglabra TFB-10046 SS5]
MLTRIFAYLDFDDLMSVTHVCTFWRAAAIGFSQLWSTIEAGEHHGALAELLHRAHNVKRMTLVLEGRVTRFVPELKSLSARNDTGLLDSLALTGQVRVPEDFSALGAFGPVLSFLHLRAPSRHDYPRHEDSSYEETDLEENPYSPVHRRSRFLVHMPASVFNGNVAVQLKILVMGRGVKFSVDNATPFAFLERLDHTLHSLTVLDLQALQVMFPSLKHLRLKIDICDVHALSTGIRHRGEQLISLDLVYSPLPSHFYRTNATLMQPLIVGYFVLNDVRHTRLRYHRGCFRRTTGYQFRDTWGRWDIHEAIIRAREQSAECDTCDLRHADGRTLHVLRVPANELQAFPPPMWGSLRRLTVSRAWLAAKTIPPMENLVELVILLEGGVPDSRPLSSNGDGVMAPLVCKQLRTLVLAADPARSSPTAVTPSLSAADILHFYNNCLKMDSQYLAFLYLQDVELMDVDWAAIAIEFWAAILTYETLNSPVAIKFDEEVNAWWWERKADI